MKLLLLSMLVLIFFPMSWAKEKLIQTELQAHPLLKKRIASYIEQLNQKTTSAQAMAKLVRLGKIAAPQLLAAISATKSTTLKRHLVKIVARSRITASVPILLACLADENENPRLREAAASALEAFHSIEVLKGLCHYAFHRDARVNRSAAYALCRIINKRAIPYLIRLLKHWDAGIRHKAHNSLIKLTGRTTNPDYELWHKWWSDYNDIFEEPR